MKTQIELAGVGGQGLISMGETMGAAAAIHEELYATLTSAYGSETRGTFAKSSVIISDAPISFPDITRPDLLLCLAQVAYDRYADRLVEGTKVFYDSEEVQPRPDARGEHFGYPFRRMGLEMGNPAVANTIAMGVMIRKVGMLRRESVAAAIAERFAGKDKVIALNLEALEKGIRLGGEA